MADYTPKFTPGQDITPTASAPVTAGRLVTVSGDNSVALSQAGDISLGVACRDAAVNDRLPVTRGGVQNLTAEGAIAAGDRVAAADDGKVETAGEDAPELGTALAAAADGATVPVALDR